MSINSARRRWLLHLGLVPVVVTAAILGISRREPTLEGCPVRDLVRNARSANSEAAAVFRRNGSNSVPGLVELIGSHPSLASRAALELTRHYWVFAHLPGRMQNWANNSQQEAMLREADREWAVVWCASLNQDAATAHAALLGACQDPNPRVRTEAVKALLRTEVPAAVAVQTLTNLLLHDSSSDVKSWAAFYLGLLHENAEAALPALRQATNDPGWQVASRAREAVEKIEIAVRQKHGEDGPPGSISVAR